MIESKYKDIKPSDLDDTNSKYDMDAHMPFPTNKFIRAETGIDLVIATGSEEEANARIKSLTREAMSILKSSKVGNNKQTLEFLIAKDKQYRYDFIVYVASFIEASQTGDVKEIVQTINMNPLEALPNKCINIIRGSNLGIDRFQFNIFNVRSDY